MKKILLLFMAVLGLGVTARAADGDEFTIDNLKYSVLSEADHEVSVVGYETEPTGDLVIPSYVTNNSSRYFVTEIGAEALAWCSSLTSVTIPNSVTKIGDRAIRSCYSLTSVTIPNSVTSIGEDAFTACKSLTSITIPNSVTSIGAWAFSNCSSLTSVTIPSSMTSIGDYVFCNCSSLTSVTIPNSVASIGVWAFKDCSSLTSVTIPNSVTEIGDGAFMSCSSLTSVTIPNSVTKIGNGIFADCSLLEAILVEDGNTEFTSEDGVLFNKGMTALYQCPCTKESYAIPNSVTAIANYAFSGCSNLTSVTMSNSVTFIGTHVFRGCSSLTSVTMSNSVTHINTAAFSGCSSLTSVTIPGSTTYLGINAFSGCVSLKTIFALPATPPTCGNGVFNNVPTDAVVYIPNGSLKAYFVADGWTYFTDFREMGALDITLSETALTLNEGETATITATVTKDDDMTIESETWATSNPEVATVEDGVVTAVAEGTATISFTVVDGFGIPHTETCEVEVKEVNAIENVSADGNNAPAEYFNLNGIRVSGNALTPGLYIKRQGNKAEKVLVK